MRRRGSFVPFALRNRSQLCAMPRHGIPRQLSIVPRPAHEALNKALLLFHLGHEVPMTYVISTDAERHRIHPPRELAASFLRIIFTPEVWRCCSGFMTQKGHVPTLLFLREGHGLLVCLFRFVGFLFLQCVRLCSSPAQQTPS